MGRALQAPWCRAAMNCRWWLLLQEEVGLGALFNKSNHRTHSSFNLGIAAGEVMIIQYSFLSKSLDTACRIKVQGAVSKVQFSSSGSILLISFLLDEVHHIQVFDSSSMMKELVRYTYK